MSRIARWTRWFAPTLAALLVLIGTFGVASAAERGSTTPPPANYAELQKQYNLRQLQLRSLDELLKRDDRRSAEVAKLIAYAKAAGKNTTALEQALATYRAKLGVARTAWYTAAAVLKTHTGFSAAGKVTNPDQARATLKAATSALEKSYLTARGAEELLNKALAAIRAQK
jgi:hypothetical protein